MTSLILAIIFLATSWTAIFAALYIHFKYRCYIERQLWGHSFVDMGFIFNSYQLMIHAHYVLFPKSAERKNVAHVYTNLPSPLRKALSIIYVCAIVSVVSLAAGYLIMEHIE